jgi:hypothetical protein
MRAKALVLLSGLLLAVLAGSALQDTATNSDPPVVAACAVQGESCDQPALDGGRQSVLSHHVLAGGCPQADLHVMKFTDGRQPQITVASWCS